MFISASFVHKSSQDHMVLPEHPFPTAAKPWKKGNWYKEIQTPRQGSRLAWIQRTYPNFSLILKLSRAFGSSCLP